MKIAVLKETFPGEKRVPLIPPSVDKLVKLGAEVEIEAGLGETCRLPDSDYEKVGATINADRQALLKSAEMVLRLRKPPVEEIALMKKGCIHVSYLDPFNEKEMVSRMQESGISCVSLEMIPRSTIAQKMDVLSSQANLGGYVAVILGAEQLDKIFPMMTTPAGTIKPARVFIIGVGVAGLQAIATARRMGARVDAFDTRPVVEEQVKSLGAKFVKIDLGETGQTKDGYAVQLTPEQLEKQKQGQAAQIAESDLVITTAQVFGRRPPVLVTREMVRGMRPGSVIVDMAAEGGGNVEGTVPGQTVVVDGVTIIGDGNWPNVVARDASQMYASNLLNLVGEYWDKEARRMSIDFADDILQGCVITHAGEVVNATIKNLKR
jgi:NAD(P) transhydrogenase subunit alpha